MRGRRVDKFAWADAVSNVATMWVMRCKVAVDEPALGGCCLPPRPCRERPGFEQFRNRGGKTVFWTSIEVPNAKPGIPNGLLDLFHFPRGMEGPFQGTSQRRLILGDLGNFKFQLGVPTFSRGWALSFRGRKIQTGILSFGGILFEFLARR